MPSSRVIIKLLAALLVAAAFGHLQNPAIAACFKPLTGKHAGKYQEQAKGPVTARSFAAAPSKEKSTSKKRHKRVLISKVFRPATTVIFLKKYRVIESFTDYSSPHVLKRTIVVASLRGPPLS